MNIPTKSISTVRPGYLVSLKTSIRGNVTYVKEVIDPERLTEAGAKQEKWQTERTVSDPAEHEAAKRARSKIGSLFRGACVQSSFGLLCPEANEAALADAIAESRKIADEFNKTSSITRLGVDVLCGRITPDDVAAVRAINSEIRELMGDMTGSISNGDVAGVREAASRLKSVGEMLSVDAQAKVRLAVEAGRGAARELVKTEGKSVDLAAIKMIEDVGAHFDLSEPAEVGAPRSAPGAELDLAAE